MAADKVKVYAIAQDASCHQFVLSLGPTHLERQSLELHLATQPAQ